MAQCFSDWRHARGEERVLEYILVEELDAVLCIKVLC